MRYYRIKDEGYHRWGKPLYWIEVNDQGDAVRQLEQYPNGKVVSYDRDHCEDDYSALGIMVVDGDDEWWLPYQITLQEFETAWRDHTPANRDT